jgi:hypothetical protein
MTKERLHNMADYDNTNRGSIWKNEKKTEPNHPDFTGELNVAGIEYWVSAWKRKEGAKPTAPALSFSIKIKEPKGQQARQDAPSSSRPSSDYEEEVPF